MPEIQTTVQVVLIFDVRPWMRTCKVRAAGERGPWSETLMGIYNPVGRARNSNRPMVGFSFCVVFGKKDVLFL